MYGFRQTRKIVNNKLVHNLKRFGYEPVVLTLGLRKCNTRNTKNTLGDDNFGICYNSKANADHLIVALQQICIITIDWKGYSYCELALNWDYENQLVEISIPGYMTMCYIKI